LCWAIVFQRVSSFKPSEAYPLLLADKLRGAGLNFQVTNASAIGGTTEGGLERLPAHLKRKIDIFISSLVSTMRFVVFRSIKFEPISRPSSIR